MKRKKCQLVNLNDAHSLSVGYTAASLAKIPIRVISRRADFPSKKNVIFRRKYAQNVDAVLANSEEVKNGMVEDGIDPKLIHVIPDGIDFAPYEDKASKDYLRQEFSFVQDNFLVGIVAPASDVKEQKYLIQVSKHLRESNPKIKIIIMGKGPLQLESNDRVKEFQAADIVFHLGFDEDTPKVLKSLDVFVLVSDQQSLGNIIRDAMACRLPIVAARTGKIPEAIDHQKTGLLVPPQRPKSLATAILKMHENKELAVRLGKNGFENVHQKFSAESMALRAINLFEELATKKGIKLSQKK
jgi:glycosyltransferase involved in cell wall biosynthesis